MRKNIFLFFCLCIILYGVFALFSMREPILGDSCSLLIVSKVFSNQALQQYFEKNIGVDHPSLYVHFLALLDKLFPLNYINVKLGGIISFIVSLILIYAITQKVFEHDPKRYAIGRISIFLYAINPMVIQGSLVPYIDTTILVPLLLFFSYLFVGLRNKHSYLILGLVFALLLWIKLTTPFALFLALMIFYFFKGRPKQGIQEAGLILLVGMSLFLVSWFIYSCFAKKPFLQPFFHTQDAFFYASPFFWHVPVNQIILYLIRVLFRLIFYVTPFYFLVFFMAAWQRIKEHIVKRQAQDIDFLLTLSLIIFFAYLFTGGLAHSFPMYHYPFLAFSAILCAAFLAERLTSKPRYVALYVVLAIAVCIYNILLVGDFLYSSDYALRESLIKTGLISPNVHGHLVVQILLYITPFLAALLLVRRRNISLKYSIISIWILASSFSMDVLQAKADYNTVYCYGGRGTEEMVAFVQERKIRNQSIVAPADVFYYIDGADFLTSRDYRFPNSIFSSPDVFISVIEQNRPDFIVFSISSNTVAQYQKTFNNPKVIDFLEHGFARKDIGSYTIWYKRILKR